ncbi:MAG: DUF3122 domain-containing protein [Leptolyngbyaceae cyanobacterium]
MTHHFHKIISWLTAMVLMGISLLSPILSTSPALAAIRQLEEATGQIVYQSRQAISDQHGDRWQVIAFNRLRPDGSSHVYLRLVGFPGSVTIDRTQPLQLISSMQQIFTVQDASSHIFTNESAPEPHIGQYDLQAIASQLPTAIPMQLVLPTVGQEAIVLALSPGLIQEWQTVATHN